MVGQLLIDFVRDAISDSIRPGSTERMIENMNHYVKQRLVGESHPTTAEHLRMVRGPRPARLRILVGAWLVLCIGLAFGRAVQSSQRTADTNSRASAELPPPDTDKATRVQAAKAPIVAADPSAYIIGEQDSLMITVWKEKEISGAVIVRPDGKITVPLVGEVKAVGMTPLQLQTILAEKLKPYVTVPQVTVAVSEIRSRKVYLIGHAAREGPFTI